MNDEAPAERAGVFCFNPDHDVHGMGFNFTKLAPRRFIIPKYFHIFIFLILGFHAIISSAGPQEKKTISSLVIARVKYQGGGDWYNDPSIIPNLCGYLNLNTGIDASETEAQVSLTEENLFSYPIIFLTGHGRIVLSEEEANHLRMYLLKGGFLYADDDYGMNDSFRRIMNQVFPERKLAELPFSHGIYHIHYVFNNGLPKIHEHDNKAPQGFGLFDDTERLMVFYTYETNISDGWADPDVYHDPPDKREVAFKMGVNIIIWALTH